MPKIEVFEGKTEEEREAEAAALAAEGERAEEELEEEQEEETENPEGAETVEETEAAEEEETIVSIGDEPVEEAAERHTAAPEWLKDLRRRNRELTRELRELKEKAGSGGQVVNRIQVGKKPTLDSCDFDSERFERELDAWYETKRKADEQEATEKRELENQNRAYAERMDVYQKAKSAIKVSDFDEAEATCQEALSATQQGIIVSGVKNSALMIYALGKNPAKLKELAAIKDPIQFTFAIANLEPQLKTTTRKPPAPERRPNGGVGTSGVVSNELEKLRAEAEKTGDYTKVAAYKMAQRTKKRA